MFREYFILLLLGHVIGDFYVQTKKIAEKKEKKIKWVLLHGFYYWIVMLLTILPVISFEMVLAASIAAFLHLIIDLSKQIYLVFKAKKAENRQFRERNIFFVDQIVHLLCIVFIAYCMASNHMVIREWKIIEDFFAIVGISEMKFLSWMLGLLLVHKPANIAIQKLLRIYKPQDELNDEKHDANAGRFIGTVERIIMLIFLSVGQYASIGLVLTAKSIARYERISKEKDFAEYYLLGTLVSTVIVIIVSFLYK